MSGPDGLFQRRGTRDSLYTPPPSSLTTPSTVGATSTLVVGEPTVAQAVEASKKGLIWDKTKKGFVKVGQFAKDTGITGGLIDKLKDTLGIGTPTQTDQTTYVAPADEPKGLSKGAKIGIAVGGAVVLGLIIWAIAKKK
jgi:hypothetical protein